MAINCCVGIFIIFRVVVKIVRGREKAIPYSS